MILSLNRKPLPFLTLQIIFDGIKIGLPSKARSPHTLRFAVADRQDDCALIQEYQTLKHQDYSARRIDEVCLCAVRQAHTFVSILNGVTYRPIAIFLDL
jgi:hypothetical protein